MFPAYAYLSAYDRHKRLINDYLLLRGSCISQFTRDTSRDKTDHDVIRENHRFLWDEDSDGPNTWGARLAKKYYDKLFKEYCICDLTYYKYNKVALRWRTEREVIAGKGQFECGNKKCSEKEDLRSWEVNFGYEEQGEKKNALVKLRLCSDCSAKLNFHSQKREVKRKKCVKRLGALTGSNTEEPSTSRKPDDIVALSEDQSQRRTALAQSETDVSRVWREKATDSLEKSREQEFEDYLADLLM